MGAQLHLSLFLADGVPQGGALLLSLAPELRADGSAAADGSGGSAGANSGAALAGLALLSSSVGGVVLGAALDNAGAEDAALNLTLTFAAADLPSGEIAISLGPLALPRAPPAAPFRALSRALTADGAGAVLNVAPAEELGAPPALLRVSGLRDASVTLAEPRPRALSVLSLNCTLESALPSAAPVGAAAAEAAAAAAAPSAAAVRVVLPAAFEAGLALGELASVLVYDAASGGALNGSYSARVAAASRDTISAAPDSISAALAAAARGPAVQLVFDGSGGASAALRAPAGASLQLRLPAIRAPARSSAYLPSEPPASAAAAALLTFGSAALATLASGGAAELERALAGLEVGILPAEASVLGASLSDPTVGAPTALRLRLRLPLGLPGGNGTVGGLELTLGGGYTCVTAGETAAGGWALEAYASGARARRALGGPGGAVPANASATHPFGGDTLTLAVTAAARRACAAASAAQGASLTLRLEVAAATPAAPADGAALLAALLDGEPGAPGFVSLTYNETLIELEVHGLRAPPHAKPASAVSVSSWVALEYGGCGGGNASNVTADVDADGVADAGACVSGEPARALALVATADADAAGLAVEPGAPLSVAAALSPARADAEASLEIVISPSALWPPGGALELVLPPDFALASAYAGAPLSAAAVGARDNGNGTRAPVGATLDGALAASLLAPTAEGRLVVQVARSGSGASAVPAGTPVGVRIAGLWTPGSRRTLEPIALVTRTAPEGSAEGSALIDVFSGDSLALELDGLRDVRVELADARASAPPTTLTLTLTPPQPLGRWDGVRLSLPPGFSLDVAAAAATLLGNVSAPLDGALSVSAGARATIEGGVDVLVMRSGGTTAPANATYALAISGVIPAGDAAAADNVSAHVRHVSFGGRQRDGQTVGLGLPLRALGRGAVALSDARVGARADLALRFALDATAAADVSDAADAADAAAGSAASVVVVVVAVPTPLALLGEAPSARLLRLASGGEEGFGFDDASAAGSTELAAALNVTAYADAAALGAAGFASAAAAAGAVAGALAVQLPKAAAALLGGGGGGAVHALVLSDGSGAGGVLRAPAAAQTSQPFGLRLHRTDRAADAADAAASTGGYNGGFILGRDGGAALQVGILGLGGAQLVLSSAVVRAEATAYLSITLGPGTALSPPPLAPFAVVRLPAALGADAATISADASADAAAAGAALGLEAAAGATALGAALVVSAANVSTSPPALLLGGEAEADAPDGATLLLLACADDGGACALGAGGTLVVSLDFVTAPAAVPDPSGALPTVAVGVLNTSAAGGAALVAGDAPAAAAAGASATVEAALAVALPTFSAAVLTPLALAPAAPAAGGTRAPPLDAETLELNFTLPHPLPVGAQLQLALPATYALANRTGPPPGARLLLAGGGGAGGVVEALTVVAAPTAALGSCAALTACLTAPSTVRPIDVNSFALDGLLLTLARPDGGAELDGSSADAAFTLQVEGIRAPSYAGAAVRATLLARTAGGELLAASASSSSSSPFSLTPTGLSDARVTFAAVPRAGATSELRLAFTPPSAAALAAAGGAGGADLVLAAVLPCGFEIARGGEGASVSLLADAQLVGSAVLGGAHADAALGAGGALAAMAARLDCPDPLLAAADDGADVDGDGVRDAVGLSNRTVLLNATAALLSAQIEVQVRILGVRLPLRAGVSGGAALALLRSDTSETLLHSAGGGLRLGVSAGVLGVGGGGTGATFADARAGAAATSLTLDLVLANPLPAGGDVVVELPAALAPWSAAAAAAVGVVEAGWAEATPLAGNATGPEAAWDVRARFEGSAAGTTSLSVARRLDGGAAAGGAGAPAPLPAGARVRFSLGPLALPAALTTLTVHAYTRGQASANSSFAATPPGAPRDAVALLAPMAPSPAYALAATAAPRRAGAEIAISYAFAHASRLEANSLVWLALPPGFALASALGAVRVTDALGADDGGAADGALYGDGSSRARAARAWRALRALLLQGGGEAEAEDVGATQPSLQPLDGTFSALSGRYSFGTELADGFSAGQAGHASAAACASARSTALAAAASPSAIGECRLVLLLARGSSEDAEATPMLPRDAHALTLSGIRAPPASATPAGAHVVTAASAASAIDSTVGASNGTVVVVPNVLRESASGTSDVRAGSVVRLQLLFQTFNPLPADAELAVRLPNGYEVTAETASFVSPSPLSLAAAGSQPLVPLGPSALALYAQLTGTLELAGIAAGADALSDAELPAAARAALQGGSLGAVGAGGGTLVRVRRAGFATLRAGGLYHLLELRSVRLPPWSHASCCFELSTLTGAGAVIDEAPPFDPVEIEPGVLAIDRAAFTEPRAGASTGLALRVRTSNPLPEGGVVLLTLGALMRFEPDGALIRAAVGSAGEPLPPLAPVPVRAWAEPGAVRDADYNGTANATVLELDLVAGLGLGAGNVSANTTIDLEIASGITLPRFEIGALPGLWVETRFGAEGSALGAAVDEVQGSALAPAVLPNRLLVAMELDESRVGARSSLVAFMVLSNPFEPGASLALYLPADFSVESSVLGAETHGAFAYDRACSALEGAAVAEPGGGGGAAWACPPLSPLVDVDLSLARSAASGGRSVAAGLGLANRTRYTLKHADPAGAAARADGGVLRAGVVFALRIAGLINPRSAGEYAREGAELYDAEGRLVDSSAGTSAPVLSIRPHELLDVTLELDDDSAGAITGARVTFSTTNAIPADGQLVLQLPRGFRLLSPALGGFTFAGSVGVVSQSARGIERIEGEFDVESSGGNGTTVADDSIITATRFGDEAEDTAPGERHRIHVQHLQNPLEETFSGSFTLSTRTRAGAVIDQNAEPMRVRIKAANADAASGGGGGDDDDDDANAELSDPQRAAALAAAMLTLAVVVVAIFSAVAFFYLRRRHRRLVAEAAAERRRLAEEAEEEERRQAARSAAAAGPNFYPVFSI